MNPAGKVRCDRDKKNGGVGAGKSVNFGTSQTCATEHLN
jgi:hypothetical protein